MFPQDGTYSYVVSYTNYLERFFFGILSKFDICPIFIDIEGSIDWDLAYTRI